MKSTDYIVVIRTSGERTLNICKELVELQVNKNSIFIVKDKPFERTLNRCYEIGSDSDKTWMLTIDADVLIRPGAIIDFLSIANQMSNNVFQFEGVVFDKFLNRFRGAGHRFYRCKYLKLALNYIPKPGTEYRPETYVLDKMHSDGYYSRNISEIFGIHDFEQSYKDIYRKAVVHSFKHFEELSQFNNNWLRSANSDDDFKVFTYGLFEGQINKSEYSLDANKFEKNSEQLLAYLSLSEKQEHFEISKIEELVKQVINRNENFTNENLVKRFSQIIKDRGLINGAKFFTGSIAWRIAKSMKKYDFE